MLDYKLLKDQGVIQIHPESPVLARDFAEVNELVNRYQHVHGPLKGLLIDSDDKPGLEEFSEGVGQQKCSALLQTEKLRIAAISDQTINDLLENIKAQLHNAEVKGFPSEDKEEALSWANQQILQ